MKPDKTSKGSGRIPPQWMAVLWYLPIMLFLLWMWQQAFSNLAVRSIPYSEFKNYLQHGEVSEALVKQDTVEGKIQPRTGAP
ncbi:MAG: ATP-dependent zinc metalloprotease FtsH, partial [Pedosphaera sp.]|nr:ATP-dependent zinc metalloprotease FtsH [Pedosphaera sp.]